MCIERSVRKAVALRLLLEQPQKVALAYQLLNDGMASFGGGPNVNSRDAATLGG